jgi:hypothetical protein
MTALGDFLMRGSVSPAGVLPVVHTRPSRLLKNISQHSAIAPEPCDVFVGEDLSYFFVGRPAYKYWSDGREAEYWELPCCFIFEFATLQNIKRVFPFDSGAFHNRLYPPYLNQMRLEDFEVSSVADSVSRIVGAFFGDLPSYFALRPKDERAFEAEFNLDVFDAEIRGLHRLAREKSPTTFDDRRFSIEMQDTSTIDLLVKNPLAVIAPYNYFKNGTFRDLVTNSWRATPLGYPTYALSVSGSYHAVY